jgi:hypothetical protein
LCGVAKGGQCQEPTYALQQSKATARLLRPVLAAQNFTLPPWLGHRGIDTFIERHPGLVSAAKAWIHLGANIGAAQGAGNNLQASDDEMESMMAEAMIKAGLRIDRRLPRGAVPRGEAENVHRGGGRYISIIGNNDLFHNTSDQGVEAVDLKVIERFASALAMVTTSLARA